MIFLPYHITTFSYTGVRYSSGVSSTDGWLQRGDFVKVERVYHTDFPHRQFRTNPPATPHLILSSLPTYKAFGKALCVTTTIIALHAAFRNDYFMAHRFLVRGTVPQVLGQTVWSILMGCYMVYGRPLRHSGSFGSVLGVFCALYGGEQDPFSGGFTNLLITCGNKEASRAPTWPLGENEQATQKHGKQTG